MIVKNHIAHFQTQGFCHVVDITAEVSERVAEDGVAQGTATVFVVGSTAGVTTVEFEPGLVQDLQDFYDRLVPPTRDYHHEETWHDGNGFSHVRASLLRPSLTIPVVDGRLRLGTWQQIVLLDFDNRPRRREICIQVMGV